MAEIKIRKMEERDIDAVLELMKALALQQGQTEYLKTDKQTFVKHAFHDRPTIGVVVAEKGEALVGYVSYTKSFSIWLGTSYVSIDDVFVQEGFRSQGTGRMLMHYMRQVARAEDFRLIRWGVEKDNDQAIKFYKSLGATYIEKGVCSWYL